ncbi:MAG: alpha-amylase/4-alpha-glucanotransferase domain-containing protein [Sphaerochaetaceae bacterium]
MRLIFGAYSQLSSGTPAPILERALSDIYKPVLTYLYKHPALKLHFYIPGTIMEWLEQNHPEVNMLIADLCKKDQLEMLTGTFHQPVLQILPIKDRSAQIEATTTFIRKRYGKRARTVWFFNQVWNPGYISTMALSSSDRLIISAFDRLTGLNMTGEPFAMQDMGKTIEVFPSHMDVSSLVAALGDGRLSLKQFVDALLEIPIDNKHEYETVMVNLDQLLEACAINPILPVPLDIFAMILDKFLQQTVMTVLLASIPTGSLSLHGYLPAGWFGYDCSLVDIGSFNQVLIKYEELNHLYGKTLYLMELAKIYRRNRDVKKRIEQLLQKAVGGAPFVLDSSGGFYRSNYRKHAYKYLIEVERTLAVEEEVPYPREADIDHDGNNEYLLMGKNFSVVIDRKGGTLAEINYLPTGWNYGDTFTGYALEADRLSFPSLRDGSFQRSYNDVFIAKDANYEQYSKHGSKMAMDTSSTLYDVALCDKQGAEVLATTAFHGLPFNLGDLRLEKRFKFRLHTIVVEYVLTNIGNKRSQGHFGSEMNLSIGTKNGDISLYTVESSKNRTINPGKAVVPELKNVRISDEVNKTYLSMASDTRFTLCKDDFKVKLATLCGKEVLYEYTQVLPIWDFDLAEGESFSCTLGFRIEGRVKSLSQ